MREELKYTLFEDSECISEQKMFDYIDNKFSAKEQHLLEKHMLHCELCSDALDGLQLLKNRNRIDAIKLIVKEKISIAPDKKIIYFNIKIITSVAAGLLLLIGGVIFFNNFFLNKNEAAVAELKEEMISEIPMARFADASETANAIAFLASPAASYITGINLPVDGGRTSSL